METIEITEGLYMEDKEIVRRVVKDLIKKISCNKHTSVTNKDFDETNVDTSINIVDNKVVKKYYFENYRGIPVERNEDIVSENENDVQIVNTIYGLIKLYKLTRISDIKINSY